MTLTRPTRADRDLEDFRSGRITLDELAQRWADRRMGRKSVHRPTDATEVYEQADNKDYFAPGTWGEIRLMRLQGRLSPSEYRVVSMAADPVASRQSIKLFSTPSPSGVPTSGLTEPGTITAAFNPDQPRAEDGKFAPGDGDGGGDAKAQPPVSLNSPEFQFAVNEWLGGTSYAEDTRDGKPAYPEGGPVADKVSEGNRALLAQAVQTSGTESAIPLYRGIGLTNSDVDALRPGSVVNLPASSFSPREENARAYGEQSAIALEDIGEGDSHEVLLEAPVGTRSIDISDTGMKAWGEPEHVVAGQFVVDGVNMDRDGLIRVRLAVPKG